MVVWWRMEVERTLNAGRYVELGDCSPEETEGRGNQYPGLLNNTTSETPLTSIDTAPYG
jgi:hypothetical protein